MEIVNKLSEVKQKESQDWVRDFNELRKTWANKTICANIVKIGE